MTQAFLAPFTPVTHASSALRHNAISSRRPRTTRITGPTCVWFERSATVLIEVSPEDAYDHYIDLEAMPKWSPWLKKVEVDPVDGDVSRWTLAARGIEISWKARNTEVRRGEIIAWKSETGLPNKGKVLFEKAGDANSYLTLSIQFDVPGALHKLFDNNFIGRFVEDTLLADLKRFRQATLAQRRRARAKGLASAADAES